VLPFKLFGLVFKGLAVLLALPFMLLFGVFGLLFLGAGLFVFVIPALPFVILAVLIWALFRIRDRAGNPSHTSAGASS
jgi:hypothetical protein